LKITIRIGYTLYFQELESLIYIFAADSMALSSFKFFCWAPYSSNVGPISPRFSDIAGFLHMTSSLFHPNFGGVP